MLWTLTAASSITSATRSTLTCCAMCGRRGGEKGGVEEKWGGIRDGEERCRGWGGREAG